MQKSTVRFTSFPLTRPPPEFAAGLLDAFRANEHAIGTDARPKGLMSNEVLAILRPSLETLGFQVEQDKTGAGKIERPVFYGELGAPTLKYQIDAFHAGWRCGLEIEAGRAWMGNAVYRDLVQAMVMVQVDYLCLAVPNSYRYKSSGKDAVSHDYENAKAVAAALYGHDRVRVPYGLLLVGY